MNDKERKERERTILCNIMKESMDYYSLDAVLAATSIISFRDYDAVAAIKYLIENCTFDSPMLAGEIAFILGQYSIEKERKSSQPADRLTISHRTISTPDTNDIKTFPYGRQRKTEGGGTDTDCRHVYHTFDGDILNIISISEMNANRYYNDALRAANGNRFVAIDYLHNMIDTKIEEIKMIIEAIKNLT